MFDSYNGLLNATPHQGFLLQIAGFSPLFTNSLGGADGREELNHPETVQRLGLRK